ncbi:hypothetical protein IGB42_03821 [Andreprevotia sp. IGB-42]|uniref:substrate-binding periplasmic protein n=1 Tax=Andreprevotia sp. IGB-42 TaxID=2497473 RepID=UPI001358EB9F|nr:transporter substrate-binding domain-containing protein [Andreprevotia sp. IGB-42]KAF0811663.1 hypothetical protein IGB42_03821 [Andreprevotia sp. IGB-42]
MKPLLLLLLFFAGMARASPVVLTLQDYPPFMGEQLPGKGLLTAAVVAVFERAGYEARLEAVPNNRAIEAPRRGLADGSFGWARTPEREKDLYYTAPVMSLRMVFCQKKGREYAWRTLPDLAPYKIGLTLGNYYSDSFDLLVQSGKLKTDAAPSDEANLRKLLSGRIDLFPIDAEVGPYLMRRTLSIAEQAQLSCPDRAYWSAPLHVVISRKRADAPAIVAAFDKALGDMQRSGELTRLIDTTRRQVLGGTSASPKVE